jgi:hypothetical protein
MWRRLAIVASVFNVAGAGFAIAAGEGWHAGIHVTLALAFAFAAQRLTGGGGQRNSESASIQQQLDEQAAALEDAQAKLAMQATQLAELNERVDFAERLLTQARDRQALDK